MKRSIFGNKRIVKVLALSGCVLLAATQVYGDSSAQPLVHEVVAGDTLWSLSKKYSVTVDDLRSANNMSKDAVLKVGERLTIPEKRSGGQARAAAARSGSRQYDVYTVQKGDTLYHIAQINSITVAELKKLNGFTDRSVLQIGQQLKIPVTIVDTEAALAELDGLDLPEDADLPDLPSNDPRNYSSKKGDPSLEWPVKNPTVTYLKGKSNGVQLSAQENESVTSIRAGTVTYVGSYRGYGQVVFVQSKTGFIYAYSGLDSIKVKKGDYVVFGDTLGTAGTDGIKGTSQITLMVYEKSSPVDPATAPRG